MKSFPKTLISILLCGILHSHPVFAEEKSSSFDIDISSVAPWLTRLPPSEAHDQLRDWALYGLQQAAGIYEDESAFPVRNPRRNGFSSLPTGNGRIAAGPDQEWLIILDHNTPHELRNAGLLFDGGMAHHDTPPKQIRIFTWETDPSSRTIHVTPIRDVRSDELRSTTAGYFSAAVSSVDDLRRFLENIDDLTMVSWAGGKLHLEGRKIRDDRSAALGMEDVAALYQAYNPPHGGNSPQVGFSLDPAFNHAGISSDLRSVAAQQPGVVPPDDSELIAFINQNRKELTNAADAVERQHSGMPFIRVRRACAKLKEPVARRFEALLAAIEYRNAYQKARYDGNLRGTHAAMILFQTDLLAKLWALDYQGIFPQGTIEGFLPMSRIPVPRLYWDDFLKYSKTRLWFGVKKDAFFINDTELRFLPVATRVYAASSDPLYPGKETKPNRQSEQFLGWWDRHYQAVADHEPSYHRLNELQKWSCVFMACRELRVGGWEFLGAAPVDRSIDFSSWIGQNGFGQKPVSLPFIDRASLKEKNECLALLRSADYPLMGQRFYLSGGVSLASAADIRNRIKNRNFNHTKKPSIAKSPDRKRHDTYRTGITPVAATRKTQTASAARSVDGLFSVSAKETNIGFAWKKSTRVQLEEFIDDLAAAQNAEQEKKTPEDLLRTKSGAGKIICVEQNKRYLVKREDMNGEWIDVGVNLQRKATDNAALGSGDRPDSDIFSGVLLSDKKARQMAGQ